MPILMRASLLTLAALLAVAPVCDAQQIQSRAVARAALPRVPIQGDLVLAREWTDRGGRNLLVLTRGAERDSPAGCESDDGCTDRELYAYHYVQRGDGGHSLLWTTTDFVRGCSFDLSLKFNPRSVAITDLDGDGTAETTFMYLLGCRSGLDPWT